MNNFGNNSELFKLSDLQKHISDVKFDLSETKYKFIEKIGTGAYGIVCQARNNDNSRDYAIKKIKNPFNHRVKLVRTLREIRILNHFNHINIINIVDIFIKSFNDSSDIYVVFDLMESDLHKIISSKQVLSDDHIRYFMYQILCGVNYIHSASVIHRDLKPANILVNSNCHLKIADFGMSRLLATPIKNNAKFCENSASFNMTQYVMTRWYRAPELLMGQLSYNIKVDLWSCGCILAELYLKKPLFRGDNMINQLKEIIHKMGTPNNQFRLKILPIVNSLINAEGELKSTPLYDLVPTASKKVIDLLSHLLVYDPNERWSAMQTLKHIFFLKYKNPQKENICTSTLDLSFETELNTIELLKEALLSDILSINSNKPFNTSRSSNQSIWTKENYEKCSKNNSKKCEFVSIGDSPLSERTLSADSGGELGYPVAYFESEISHPNSSCKSNITTNNRLKTVSQYTKNKLINSIRKPKEKSKKKIVTAAQRQKERKERKLKLKYKRDEKVQIRKGNSLSTGFHDQLSDLDKSFLKKWEHLSKNSLQNKNDLAISGKYKQNIPEIYCTNDSFSTDQNIKLQSTELDEMSAGLSALLLLDDFIECDKNSDVLKYDSNPEIKDIQGHSINLLNDNFDLLYDVDIDCIDLDLNILESYSCDFVKDEFRNLLN